MSDPIAGQMSDLISAEQLLADNEDRKRMNEISQGLALAKIHLDEDEKLVTD